MPTVTEDVDLPLGVDPSRAVATFELIGGGGAPLKEAYNTATGTTVTGQRAVHLDGTTAESPAVGSWSLTTLDPNINLLPAGTVWGRRIAGPQIRANTTYALVPASGGPYRWDQILAEAPGTLATAALAVHAADLDLHGGGLQLFAAHKSDGLFSSTSTAPVPVTGWSGSMTVPDRPFDVTAITSMFTGTETIPSHLAVYARVAVTAAQRVGGVVTLTVPTGHGILPGVIPLVDLADNNYDLTTDVGVPGNAITAVTATTVRYSQAGGDLGTSTGFITFRVGITASVKGIGQAVAAALVPNVLWAPAEGLAVTFQPYVRTDNASSAANINSADLGGFGNGPNYAAMTATTR